MAKKQTGGAFLSLALTAFLGLGMELLLVSFEQWLYGLPMGDFSLPQQIFHWILTCVVWGAFALLLLRSARRSYGYDLLALGKGCPLSGWCWLGAAGALILCIAINAFSWGTLKVLGEWAGKTPLQFAFQYLYYLFETLLVLLLIAFGQRAGELWFHTARVPWGGLAAGLSWGLVHTLSKGELLVGLTAMAAALLYGVLYLLVHKRMLPAYLLIGMAFML